MPENNTGNLRPWYAQVLPWLVWLASAGLGLYAVYSLSKLSTAVYALIGKDYYTGVVISQAMAVAAGLAWIATIVGSGEHLRKNPAGRSAWRLLGWIVGIELVLIILGYVF